MSESSARLRVPRSWLYVLAGGLWLLAGLAVCAITIPWLMALDGVALAAVLATGLVLAALISRFGFSRIARKNIQRLDAFGERASALAFQPARSYLVILLMMAMGWTLRHSPVPKPALAIMYIGIGGGLLWSGLRYFRRSGN